MNLKAKIFKVSQVEDPITDAVEVIKEVLKKNDCKMQYKFKKNILKLKNDRIILVSKGISKEKVSCNLCLKHVRLTFADLPTKLIDGVDRCRSLEDILGNKIFIRFKSIRCASFWQRAIEKYNINEIEVYKGLTGKICVINEASDILQGNFVEDVKGDIKGVEMKDIAEKRFKMDGLLSQKYSLEIQNGKNIISVDDRSLIFYINEYLTGYIQPMFCSSICTQPPKAPSKPITLIVLDKTNEQRKNFKPDKICKRTKVGPDFMYNIDQRWPDNLMPTWLLRLLSDIYFYGPECKGIFRMNTPKLFSKSYYELMLTRDDFIIESNMFLKANVLKQFLAKVEGGLLNLLDKNFINNNISSIKSSAKFFRDVKKENMLLKTLSLLSQQRLLLLQYLLVVFKAITDNKVTCMDAYNIGAMCAPSIFNKFKYNITEYSGEAMQLSMLVECIILLFDKVVDPQSYLNIVETLTKYKSDPSTIKFEDSQTNSTISESCFSANSLTTPEKLNRYNENIEVKEYQSCDIGIESEENIPESCLNENETIISPRSRVCMGTKLFEKLNNSVVNSSQNESLVLLSPIKIVQEDSIMNLSDENYSEDCFSNQVEIPQISENAFETTTKYRRKISNPIIIFNDVKRINLMSTKENIAPLEIENATSHKPKSKTLSRKATRHSSMLVTAGSSSQTSRQRRRVRPLSLRQYNEDLIKTNIEDIKLKQSNFTEQLKFSNLLLPVEEKMKSIEILSISNSSRMSTRHSSMLETSSINTAPLRQRKKQSRPLIALNQMTRNKSRKYCNNNEESLKSNRSRSPYVKNMVEMYEKRLRSNSTNVIGSRDIEMRMVPEQNQNRKRAK